MASNCIYEVFKWMGVLIKYTGSIPLPGLYEWKGNVKVKRLLFSILLPPLYFINGAFEFFDALFMGLAIGTESSLTDILVYLVIVFFAIYTLFFPLLFYFRTSSKLVNYLELHSKIHQLIKAHQNRLNRSANRLLIFAVTVNLIDAMLFSYIRFSGRHSNEYFVYETFALLSFLYLSTCFYYQPQIMYIVFQRVLKCAFQELLKRIQEEKKAKSRCLEDAKKKMRMYGTLYRSLCQLCKLLDDMTSPMIAYMFLHRFIATVLCLTFITFDPSLDSLWLALESTSGVIVMIGIPIAAHDTKTAASKIVSAAYSSFDLNDKEIAKELQMFAAQLYQLKVQFSASGLFQLDGSLVLNIIQSLISQWVVFYKIHKNTAR